MLLFTELSLEDGPARALKRILLQYLCCSPVFEAFKSKLMGATLVRELTVGGASYVATGRGLAIARTPPHRLYATYCVPAIRDGFRVAAYLVVALAARRSDVELWGAGLTL